MNYDEAYNYFLNNPPVKTSGATYITAFWAGYNGIGGVRKGTTESISRAAWMAGAEFRKRELKTR